MPMLATLRRAAGSGGLLRVLFFAVLAFAGLLYYPIAVVIIPIIALCVAGVFLKRWIEYRNLPKAPNRRLAGAGPDRNPMRYLNASATVLRITLLFVFATMLLYMHLFDEHAGINVELARARTASSRPHAQREDAMVVTIFRDGKMYFRTQPVAVTNVARMITEGVKSGAEKRLYIKADSRARFKAVNDVLATARICGIENVTFILERSKDGDTRIDDFYNVLRP